MPEPILFELDTDEFTMATSVLPQGYTFDRSVNFNAIEIIGRSSPHQTYSGGQPIMVSVPLFLIAVETGAQEEVVDVLKSLMAITYSPEPGVKAPPLCKVTVGQFEDWECVLHNISGVGGVNQMWDEEGLPMSAEVTLNFLGIEVDNKSVDDWIGSRDFKQLSFSKGQEQA